MPSATANNHTNLTVKIYYWGVSQMSVRQAKLARSSR